MYVDPDPECHEDGWGEARSTAVGVAVATAGLSCYAAVHGLDQYFTYTAHLGPHGPVLQFAVLLGVLVAHEAVHALAYRLLAGVGWGGIAVELSYEGGLDPLHHSVHPTRAVRRRAYYASVLAPTVLLGAVPTAVGVVTGHSLATFVGTVGLLLLGTDVGTLVQAWRHPETIAVADPT